MRGDGRERSEVDQIEGHRMSPERHHEASNQGTGVRIEATDQIQAEVLG